MTIVIGSNQAHAYMKDADWCCSLNANMSHGYGAVPMILEEPMRGGGMLIKKSKAEIITLGGLYSDDTSGNYSGRVYSTDGVAPAVTTFVGGGRAVTMILEPIILDDLYEREGGREHTETRPQRLEAYVEN